LIGPDIKAGKKNPNQSDAITDLAQELREGRSRLPPRAPAPVKLTEDESKMGTVT